MENRDGDMENGDMERLIWRYGEWKWIYGEIDMENGDGEIDMERWRYGRWRYVRWRYGDEK